MQAQINRAEWEKNQQSGTYVLPAALCNWLLAPSPSAPVSMPCHTGCWGLWLRSSDLQTALRAQKEGFGSFHMLKIQKEGTSRTGKHRNSSSPHLCSHFCQLHQSTTSAWNQAVLFGRASKSAFLMLVLSHIAPSHTLRCTVQINQRTPVREAHTRHQQTDVSASSEHQKVCLKNTVLGNTSTLCVCLKPQMSN